MKKAIQLFLFLGVYVLFSGVATAQNTISHPSLVASSGNISTNDILTCNYTLGGDVVETASAWYRDYAPVTLLYMPFEGGAENALGDYSGMGASPYVSSDPLEVPTWDATGGYNGSGAFIFDGGDYIYAGDNFPTNASYTKTAWIRVNGTGFRNIICSESNDVGDHAFKVDPDGTLNAGHSFGDIIVYDPVPLVDDQWYFVAVTFDYESSVMILYKDGVEVDRAVVPEPLTHVVDRSILIGSREYTFGWQGTIDEPRVYRRALSSEQINMMYTGGNNTMLPQETAGGEVWYVVVTPFSSDGVGSFRVSDLLTLQAATISGLSLSASSADNLTTDDLTATYTSNPSVVETATTWYRNGSPEGLLYMPFEGGFSNAILDFSGSNNHPTYSENSENMPSWDITGRNGSGAFIFDISDGADYLDAGEILPLNSSYTKTAWVNFNGSGYFNIMSSVLFDDNNHAFKINPDGSLNAGHSFGASVVQSPAPLSENQWYFVAVSFNYDDGEMILYSNGIEVSRANVAEPLRDVADASVLIGSMEYGFGFNGSIDEPRLYGHVVSPQQINAMYTQGNNVKLAEETTGGEDWYVEVTPFSVSEYEGSSTSDVISVHSVVVVDIPDQTVAEGSTFNTIDLDNYVSDLEYDISELVWSSSGSSELVVDIDPVTNVATISIPDVNWYGSEDISFIATNPATDSDETEVAFTVTNTNDAPVLSDIGGQTTDEDVDLTGLVVEFTDLDPTDGHTITVVSSNPNVSMDNLNGTTSGSTYDLVPVGDWNGSTQITVTVRDNGTGTLSDSETYTLVVNPVNDPPVLTNVGPQSTDEDNALTGLSVEFTDLESLDEHTIEVVSDNSNVIVDNLNGDVSGSTYDLVPAADWNGTAQITVTVTDDGTGALSDFETYTLTVNPINDAPVIIPIGNQTTLEDNNLEDLSVDFNDPDAGASHTISVVSLEPNVTVVGLSGNTSGSTYDLVPAANWIGTAQITVTVTETGAGGLSDSEIYALTVGAINDAPVLTTVGNQIVDEDASITGLTVAFSDLDPDDEHVITVVSSESNVGIANLIGNVSGSTYDLVPSADWNGNAQITVTVTDNGTGSLSDSETYTLTVNPINDAPNYISLSNNDVDEGVEVGTVVGQLSSTDADLGDSHSYQFMFEGGDEEIDNQFFRIDGDDILVNAEMDYELKNTFSLLVQSDDGNGGTLTQQIPVTVNNIVETSIDENESLSFKVYPVPAVNRITVEVDNPRNTELLLEIYSNSGVLVHTEFTVHGNTIDLNEYARGMYIMRISGGNIFETRKFVIGN